MKETKFRGYSPLKNEWYTGCLVVGSSNDADETLVREAPLKWYTVDPLSVGQFTGVSDINNRPIYEGDLLKVDGDVYTVVYEVAGFVLKGGLKADQPIEEGHLTLSKTHERAEVVGNQYEFNKNNARIIEAVDDLNDITGKDMPAVFGRVEGNILKALSWLREKRTFNADFFAYLIQARRNLEQVQQYTAGAMERIDELERATKEPYSSRIVVKDGND